ncbi:lambda-exonuclease family protein [Streptomyces rimosus]|uniref:YqaJ viral recombinase family nuclease n=1 Tax=Streptomyces rimosus TaxID=1927 RepID=UPI0031DEA42E
MTRPAPGDVGPEVPPASGPAGPLVTPTARLLLPADASEDAWHAARRAGVGGSDVAAILGMDRYRGPLHVWEAKQGRGDTADSEAAYCGRKLEGLIAEMFGERSGLAVAPSPGTLVHAERSWARANLDRLVIESGSGRTSAPLECKNRSEYQAADWTGQVPDEPALQAHWYMAVTGYDHAWVAVLIGGNRLRWYRLERDQELGDRLMDYCGAWWQRHVIRGEPPPPDGSAATTALLARLWQAEPERAVEVDAVRTQVLLSRRAELKREQKALDAALREVENHLKAMVGAAGTATVCARPVFTWKASGQLATARLTADHPEVVTRYRACVEATDWAALAADHPELVRAYRARVLRVPGKGALS